MKKGFTLIELLVVISIIALLLAIMMPSLGLIQERAKVVVVDAELRQIGLALDVYFANNRQYPPTQEDCSSGSLTDHLYQLPKVLVKGNYLPSTPRTNPMSTTIGDRFNREHTYKYRCVGETIKDRDIIDRDIWAKLWIPENFPTKSSINEEQGRWYPNEEEYVRYLRDKSSFTLKSPVRWVVFSLGPNFSEEWLEEQLGYENRYPVPKELWYTPQKRKGFIVRMQLKNGSQIGSFEQ